MRIAIRRLPYQYALGFLLALGGLLPSPAAQAQTTPPRLSLSRMGDPLAAADAIPQGTLSYSFDLLLDSGGRTISGLQLYLEQTSPPQQSEPFTILKYGSTPVTGLGTTTTPFQAADLFSIPAAGAALVGSMTTLSTSNDTVFLKGNGDYAAVSDARVARYQLDTASLAPGAYTITPIGEELSFTGGITVDFATPGTFVLTVLPEPGTAALAGMAAAAMLFRRRRVCSSGR
jgi:uncharacterized protein (TIGR03382 family)